MESCVAQNEEHEAFIHLLYVSSEQDGQTYWWLPDKHESDPTKTSILKG